ncbi:putative membrane protein [Metarhizium anisopliae]
MARYTQTVNGADFDMRPRLPFVCVSIASIIHVLYLLILGADKERGRMALHVRLDMAPGAAQNQRGIGITGFITALSVAVLLFLIQIAVFLYLRRQHHLTHIYKPKANSNPPKAKQLLQQVIRFPDKTIPEETIKEWEGSDAYYFLRYLRTLLMTFLPISLVVVPILIPLNYSNGRGQDLDPSSRESSAVGTWQVMGLDTLAFGNIKSSNTDRYTAHLVCAVLVIVWFCCVSLTEMREYARKQRHATSPTNRISQDQHRLINTFKPVVETVRDVHRLLRKRDEALDKFESAAISLIKGKSTFKIYFKAQLYGGLFRRLESDIETKIMALDGLEELCAGKTAGQPCELCAGNRDGQPRQPRERKADGKPCERCIAVKSAWQNILWSNVGRPRWQKWIRTAFVAFILTAMIALWAIPVSWTAALSQLDTLIRNKDLRSFFLQHRTLRMLAVSVAGVLPGVALTLMLMLIPPLLECLSRIQGSTLRSQQAAFVQRFYFVFLFVQMFLVVSIASFFSSSLNQFLENIEALRSAENILNLLSQNLPTAANYFFSYMILQALSGSANILMQKAPMFWFVADRLFSYTPRQKWLRRDSMDIVGWGAVFPLYTTLACISLAYSIIAPLISLFAMISFAMLWFTHKYSVIYVKKLDSDHGGILYPRAINQTFTGIYLMELCMAGLFLGVRDDGGRQSCLRHGITMIVSLVITAIFQVVLNQVLFPAFEKNDTSDELIDKDLFKHVTHVANRSIAWLPTENSEGTYGGATVLINCNYPPEDTLNHWWRATIDERGHVQIERCVNDAEVTKTAQNC